MVACCVRQVVVLYSNNCMGIISYSSTKSMVPPLFKFTTQNLDLIFPSFRLTLLCTQWLVNILGRWKKIVPSESRIAFCWFFIVQVKKVCYEKKVQGELLWWFFNCTLKWLHFNCTLKWLHPYAPMTDGITEQGRMSVLQWNQHPTLLIQKRNKK